MAKTINDLINAKIIGIQHIYDYWQIITDISGINAYNPVKYCTHSDGCIELGSLQLDNILDHTIVAVEYKELQYLHLKLDNRNSIAISLKDADYSGPEALSIHFSTGEIMVV
jgi:hypothetical protein